MSFGDPSQFNVITGLSPIIYKALDTVPRELVGAIPGVRRWPSSQRLAKGQQATFSIVPRMAKQAITPSTGTGPSLSSITIGKDNLSITNSDCVPFAWTGEETAGIANELFAPVLQDQFAEAFRTLVGSNNDGAGIEYDLCSVAAAGACRAYGTAGATPFGTADDLSDFNYTKKILKDNGAPQGDLHLVLDTTAHAQLQSKQTVVYKANEYGSRDGILWGSLAQLQNVFIHESAGIIHHTASGAGAGTIDSVSGYDSLKGSTEIVTTGISGTPTVGDIVRFGTSEAYHADQYVVAGWNPSTKVIKLNAPGLVMDIPSGKAVTFTATSYTANLMFDRNALVLISALPNMLPMIPNGDIAKDRTVVTDPISGLQFDVALYVQYHQAAWEIAASWGVKAVKSPFIALLLG